MDKWVYIMNRGGSERVYIMSWGGSSLWSFLPEARSGERDEWVGVRPRV